MLTKNDLRDALVEAHFKIDGINKKKRDAANRRYFDQCYRYWEDNLEKEMILQVALDKVKQEKHTMVRERMHIPGIKGMFYRWRYRNYNPPYTL